MKAPAPFFRSRAYSIPTENDSHAMWTMLVVTVAHVAALLWLLHHPVASSQQPVLSFTVTLMDLSASQNSISSAASAASSPAIKPEPKKAIEEAKPEARTAKLKKKVKPVTQSSPKANSPLSHNAQAQTAVLAPITPAQFDAAYLQNPKPSYPPLSRRMGEQGNVLLAVYVNEEGRAQTVRLKKSSGFERLDNAAMESVQSWRFAAAKQGERMIASWVQVPVQFILE
jgi:periplasmic protein TonB